MQYTYFLIYIKQKKEMKTKKHLPRQMFFLSKPLQNQ